MLCRRGKIHAVYLSLKTGYEHVHDYCDMCAYRLCTRALGACTW